MKRHLGRQIVAEFARIPVDAPPESRNRFEPAYRAMLSDLGITSTEDMLARSNEVRAYLPRLMTIADEIIAANPSIGH